MSNIWRIDCVLIFSIFSFSHLSTTWRIGSFDLKKLISQWQLGALFISKTIRNGSCLILQASFFWLPLVTCWSGSYCKCWSRLYPVVSTVGRLQTAEYNFITVQDFSSSDWLWHCWLISVNPVEEYLFCAVGLIRVSRLFWDALVSLYWYDSSWRGTANHDSLEGVTVDGLLNLECSWKDDER